MNGTDLMTPGETWEDNESAGCRLRAAREQWGLSLRDVAGALNLLVSHVRAIESDHCGALAKDDQFACHLRDYASLLLLDANDVERTYRAQSVVLSEPIQERPVKNKKRHHGTWVGVGGIAIISACVGFGWFHQTLPIDTGNTTAIRSDAIGNRPPIAPQLARNDPAAMRTSEQHTDDILRFAVTEKRARSDQATLALVPKPLSAHKVGDAITHTDHGNTHSGKSAPLAVGAAPIVAITQHVGAAQEPAAAAPRPQQAGVAKPLRSNAWFATLEPDRYTLQLLSFTREESSRAFIQRRHLQEDAAYFAVDNDDGETWYAVTYGLFDSYEVAFSAIRNLPDRISDLKPRVRNTGRIQHIMRR